MIIRLCMYILGIYHYIDDIYMYRIYNSTEWK